MTQIFFYHSFVILGAGKHSRGDVRKVVISAIGILDLGDIAVFLA